MALGCIYRADLFWDWHLTGTVCHYLQEGSDDLLRVYRDWLII